jgi:acetylornithine deacetylase
MTLSPEERRIVDALASRRDDIVELATRLIAFDTTAHGVGEPPREEAALQELLAQRLREAGAAVDVWEPDPAEVSSSRQYPAGLDFAGRPQLVARFAGSGGGRSLLLNGHVDVVSSEPRERWTSDPNRAEIRGGRLYGRGACDMKGGVASMVVAAETLVALGVPLAGDLLVNTVTDEETSGIGGVAAVAHGVRADAGIVTEPTELDVWVACRGTVYPTVTVPGRPGHAEIAQPSWREGGAVNAIEKAQVVLEAMRRLREDWGERADLRHPYVSPPTVVPTVIAGGEWPVTYPADCRITCGVCYLPAQADANGFGTAIEVEFAEAIAAACAADPWLREHPATISWESDVPPMDIPPDDPIVTTLLAATADVGRPGERTGLDSWYDGATFTLSAGTPSVAYGPGRILDGHTIDESVPVDDLVAVAQGIAVAAMRFCG